MPTPYTYIWEYTVHEDCVDEFVDAYGPDGAWVKLFRSAMGYLGTELLQDRENPRRFVTIDRWESREAFETFRTQKAAEFESIDLHCERLTIEETHVGRFEPL